ncbi:MAG: nuclear transport factor 2 family protein [Sphingorhabdus sp.]
MHKLFPKSMILVIPLALALTACIRTVEKPGAPDFRAAVEQHLEAVENRDFDTFKNTLTKTDDLNVIFPGGSVLENTQAVLDFHKQWFADDKWVFKTNIEKVIGGSDQSTALVKYSFQDSADGEPREAWLVLTFQLEDGSWRLIHDQNTRIDRE